MTASKGKKHMSDAAIEANRQNAQHSTGPNTPEGKEKSKFNAFKTGMYCSDPLIPGENPEDYREFHLGMFHSLEPQNTLQMSLFDGITSQLWAMMRLPGTEANIEVFSTFQEDYTSQMNTFTLIQARKVNTVIKLINAFRATKDRAVVAQNLNTLLAVAERAHAPQPEKTEAPKDKGQTPDTQAEPQPERLTPFIPLAIPEDPEGRVVELDFIHECATQSPRRWFKNPHTFETTAFPKQVDMMLGLMNMPNPTPTDLIRNRLKRMPRLLEALEETG